MPDGNITSGAVNELEIVRTDSGLRELCDQLQHCKSFGLDTEFMGERTYLPTLSLIQVATPEWIALVDPLSLDSLDPFWEIIANPDVEKVLHAAREDLRLAHADSGVAPCNIFDTQVAAGFVGLPQYPLSYARLVEALVGVRLSKTETRSEWDKRPLTVEQKLYARDDVRYLLEIRKKLGDVISRLNRQPWLDEEMTRFSDPAFYAVDPEESYLKIRGPRSGMGARQTAYLQKVCAWREREAANQNVPVRSILRDDALTEIALRPPTHMTDFRRLRAFPSGEETVLGPAILAALQTARRLSEDELPPPLSAQGEQETTAQKAFADLAFAIATIHCQSSRLAPELVLSRAASLDLAMGKESSVLLTGWRKEVIGGTLEELLNGGLEARVSVKNGTPLVHFNKSDQGSSTEAEEPVRLTREPDAGRIPSTL